LDAADIVRLLSLVDGVVVAMLLGGARVRALPLGATEISGGRLASTTRQSSEQSHPETSVLFREKLPSVENQNLSRIIERDEDGAELHNWRLRIYIGPWFIYSVNIRLLLPQRLRQHHMAVSRCF
jgi:hypothetical protein